jgi:hypothetical protein
MIPAVVKQTSTAVPRTVQAGRFMATCSASIRRLLRERMGSMRTLEYRSGVGALLSRSCRRHKMKLYHWAADRFIASIKREGLTRGRTPFLKDGKVDFIDGHIWLTDDGDWEHQTWAIPVSIPYSRRDWRIEINIPKHAEKNIWDRNKIKDLLGETMLPGFMDFPEITDHWFVHTGTIPRQWFKSVRCFHE